MYTFVPYNARFLKADKQDLFESFNDYPKDSKEYKFYVKIYNIIEDILAAKVQAERDIEEAISNGYREFRPKVVTINNALKFRTTYLALSKQEGILKNKKEAAQKLIRSCDALLDIKTDKLYSEETAARNTLCSAIRDFKFKRFI